MVVHRNSWRTWQLTPLRPGAVEFCAKTVRLKRFRPVLVSACVGILTLQPPPVMRALVSLFALAVLTSALPAAQAPDPILVEGLQTFSTNGIEAGLRVWYSDRPELGAEMRELLFKSTRNLGSIIDTEIVAVQLVSKRVTRYYVAIYFTRCPLWLRVERYQNQDRAFYLPLRVSTNPDEILPGYITEFHQP